jgi:ligand-binding sensor domain-containing protein
MYWVNSYSFDEEEEADFGIHHKRNLPMSTCTPYPIKERQGNVWFGTSTLGVYRFDGKSFAWLPESELRNGSFGTRSIIEDKEGRFWFCSTLQRYDVDQSDSAGPKFTKVDGLRNANDPSKELFGGIMASTLDSTGALWMATYREGVWRHNEMDITHYPITDGVNTVNLFSIYEDRQGVLWLGTQEAGAYKLNGKTFERFKL